MTTKTRRRVFFSILVLALTLPAEVILLKALQSPNDRAAIRAWATGLEAPALSDAADRVHTYPVAYRKEIMRALPPAARAATWRNHIHRYMQQHPELDAAAVAALTAAMDVTTAEALSDPSAATRMSMSAIGSEIATRLGEDTARDLLYYLGPKDGNFASAEPITMKLASWVRSQYALLAQAPDCDCNMNFGCDNDARCIDWVFCNPDDSWPACGWWWNSICNGLCEGGW